MGTHKTDTMTSLLVLWVLSIVSVIVMVLWALL